MLAHRKCAFAICLALCAQSRASPKCALVAQPIAVPLEIQKTVLPMTEPSPFVPDTHIARQANSLCSEVLDLIQD